MLKTLLFLLFSFPALSQVNYSQYGDEYALGCRTDSISLVRSQQFLDSLNQFEITKGRQDFLEDRAWTYYMRYLKYKEQKDLRIATRSFQKAWNDYKSKRALHDLGGLYSDLGNCKKAKEMTEKYIAHTPDSLVDYQQMYLRYRDCVCEE